MNVLEAQARAERRWTKKNRYLRSYPSASPLLPFLLLMDGRAPARQLAYLARDNRSPSSGRASYLLARLSLAGELLRLLPATPPTSPPYTAEPAGKHNC